MPLTYSVNVGTPTESLRKKDINSVLIDIPDNTQKLISPKDIRDAFLTTWSNSSFKQTIGQGLIEYIGIDSGDPNNRDIKEKIYIGKRNYSGMDIMNNYLLSNKDTDIYINNTKPDDYLTQSTTISLLSGTNSNLYMYAPYIKSYTNNLNTSLNLDIINPSINGVININSNNGRVSINGISFPTAIETSASASNGMILKYSGNYPNGVFKWSEPNISIANIGVTNSVTNIYGSPSNVNGHSLEFVDENIVPLNLGGVKQGDSFNRFSFNGQNWPLCEVIRKILYPYVAPKLSLNVKDLNTNINYLSTGFTYSLLIDYSITRYTNNIDGYKINGYNNFNSNYSGYTSSVGNYMTGSTSDVVYNNLDGTYSYYLNVRDVQGLLTFSYSCTASIVFVHPFFYGFNSLDININDGVQVGTLMNSINRLIHPYFGLSNSISVNYNGVGYFYFIEPYSRPELMQIKDPNGFIIYSSTSSNISSFTYSTAVIPVGGDNISSSATWRVYKKILPCNCTAGKNFEFIF